MDTPLRFNMCYPVLHPKHFFASGVWVRMCSVQNTASDLCVCLCSAQNTTLQVVCQDHILSCIRHNLRRQFRTPASVRTHECALVLFMHTANPMRVIIQGLFCALCAAHVCKLFAANFSFQRLCTPTTVKVTLHVWNGNCIIATEHFTLHSFRVK